MNLEIRPETNEDAKCVWNVNRNAFETEAEANLVNALRDGGYSEVSLIAVVDGEIVGHILFTRITIVTKTGTVDALSLAPMAVLPSHQRQGIGSKLVETGLEAYLEQGHKIVVVLGHLKFDRTLRLSGWHRVVMNTEHQSRAMAQVAFLD